MYSLCFRLHSIDKKVKMGHYERSFGSILGQLCSLEKMKSHQLILNDLLKEIEVTNRKVTIVLCCVSLQRIDDGDSWSVSSSSRVVNASCFTHDVPPAFLARRGNKLFYFEPELREKAS